MSILFKDSEVGFDRMSILELRKTLLSKVVDAFVDLHESSPDLYANKHVRQRYINIASIIRRGSEGDVRAIHECIINDPDIIGSFIEEKLVAIAADEPTDMDTIEHMNRVLDVITDRYKTYVTTGDLDPLLDKLTLKQLSVITLGLDKGDKVEPCMFDTLAVMLRSIMFIDETLMFCEAPDDIGEKFLLGGVNMIFRTGAPVELKEEVNTIVDNMTTKEDIE